VKGLIQCERRSELRLLPLVATILIALASPALGQLNDQEKAAAPNTSVKYQISATITDSCRVERSLNLHEVVFDFSNASCRDRKHVIDKKIPTLPKSPRFTNVRIAGFHFVDWSEGQSSPIHNGAKVDISKTPTTLSASGWLAKASCSAGASGKAPLKGAFWKAKVVPEVQFVEDAENEEPAVMVEVVPPKATVVLSLSSSCTNDRAESLQYSITPIVNGAAQPSIYASPVLAASKTGTENEATAGALSIHSHWSPQSSSGQSELTLTISGPGAEK
jgi:hypothetical protein